MPMASSSSPSTVPGLSMNVITAEVQRDLAAAIERLKTDDAVKGAVLTSGKASGFMAGADLKGMGAMFSGGAALPDGKSKVAALFDGVFTLNKMLRDLETCGKPVAAAVNGLALGGGLEFILACHYRVVADNPKITLGLPEVMVGLFPGAGGTQRLPRLMGVQPALMYLLQGKNMSPQEALGFGVVQAVVPAADDRRHRQGLGEGQSDQGRAALGRKELQIPRRRWRLQPQFRADVRRRQCDDARQRR